MNSDKDFCFRLPKCELHAHLSGSISLTTACQLAKQRAAADSDFGTLTKDELSLLNLKKAPRDIKGAFLIFPIIQRLIERKEELITATRSVISDFAAENVIYLELRTTPKATKWMSKAEYVEVVVNTIEAMKVELPRIVVRLLLSIDRRQSVDDAKETVNIAMEYFCKPSSVVIGIELSGDPKFDGRKFLPLFKKAAKYGLPFTLHLAEVADYLEELRECLLSKPNRIGHGTFIHSNPDPDQRKFCTELIMKNKIPIEVCLTSNALCGTITSYESSHFRFYLVNQHPVALCTDDRGIMDCSLSGEFLIAARIFQLSRQALFNIAVKSFEAGFIHRKGNSDKDVKNIMKCFDVFARSEGLKLTV